MFNRWSAPGDRSLLKEFPESAAAVKTQSWRGSTEPANDMSKRGTRPRDYAPATGRVSRRREVYCLALYNARYLIHEVFNR